MKGRLIMNEISQRIKKRRLELGLSINLLAKKIGKDRATIYRYENGDIEKVPISVLRTLADALDTTPDYLMGWETVPEKNNLITIYLNGQKRTYKLSQKKLAAILALLEDDDK